MKLGYLIPTSSPSSSQYADKFARILDRFNVGLTSGYNLDDRLVFSPVYVFYSLNDTFLTSKAGLKKYSIIICLSYDKGASLACHLVESGVVSAVGNIGLSWHSELVASVFNFFNLPLILAEPETDLYRSRKRRTEHGAPAANLFPSRAALTRATADLIGHLRLDSPIIVYHEENEVVLWKEFVDAEAASGKHLQAPRLVGVDPNQAENAYM